MHRGRTYPYGRNQYLTEAFFWPGLVPWKMAATAYAVLPGNWSLVNSFSREVSEVSDSIYPQKSVRYKWPLPSPAIDSFLVCEMGKQIVAGVPYVYWAISLTILGLTIESGGFWEVYPQRLVDIHFFWNAPVPPPFGTGQAIAIDFSPATYAEGGSPWSD